VYHLPFALTACQAALTAALWTPERVAKLVDGRLKSFVHCTMDWSGAGDAHALMERNENVGKIVLAVDASLG
jgi:NADPH:quinone reductase-like Zn-dependent oxidoreductase